MSQEKFTFNKPEYFYAKGHNPLHEPVDEEQERKAEIKKLRMAKISLFLLWATITASIEYFAWWFIDSLGYKSKLIPQLFFGIFIIVILLLSFLFLGKKIDKTITGKFS